MLYTIVGALAIFFFKILYFYKIVDRQNMPEGKCLICSNHSGLSDPVFVAIATGLCSKNRPRFMAKAELFKNKLFGACLRKLGAFPVKRGTADIGAIKESLRILASDGRLLLFPEGTRNSNDGAKAGAGMLALRSDCDVVPVYVSPGRKPFHRVRVVVGEPFRPQKPEGKPGSDDYQNAADEILRRVYALESKR